METGSPKNDGKWVKIKTEVLLELNDNEYKIYQNLWNTMNLILGPYKQIGESDKSKLKDS